ncbi:hypothetical protein GS432_19485 [Rhodococcus hoagii]|nr:hypothetical protein [Prescottella equi]MBM4577743.1 hypothetical protein [Prescottella equi]
MTEIEFQKMPLWDLPIPPPREALADDNLSLAAHRWIPGDPIPYDQMRAILGLPDVRDEVMRTRLGRFAESVSGQPYAYNPERFPRNRRGRRPSDSRAGRQCDAAKDRPDSKECESTTR